MSSNPAERFSCSSNILKLLTRACENIGRGSADRLLPSRRTKPANGDQDVRHCAAACGLISSIVPLRGRHPEMAWQHFNHENRLFIRPYVGSPMALNAQGNSAAV